MTARHLRVGRTALALVLSCTALAGCFGRGDDTTPTPAVTAEVPASASESASGFIAYLMALVVAPADTLEPVDVSSVIAPTDDTGEPKPVN